MDGVSLATYTHDPEGRLLESIKERMPPLTEVYEGLFVVVTDETDRRVIELLEGIGCTVVIQEDGIGYDRVGDARRLAISAASEGGHGHVHFVDLDRVLQWAGSHADELLRVVGEIPDHEFLIIGRTPRTMETHPDSQRETERLANKVTSFVLGLGRRYGGLSWPLTRRDESHTGAF